MVSSLGKVGLLNIILRLCGQYMVPPTGLHARFASDWLISCCTQGLSSRKPLAVVSVGWSADAWAVTLCPKKPALPGEVSDALTLRSSNIPGFVVLTEIHSESSGKKIS